LNRRARKDRRGFVAAAAAAITFFIAAIGSIFPQVLPKIAATGTKLQQFNETSPLVPLSIA
jgi:hypothetical protein